METRLTSTVLTPMTASLDTRENSSRLRKKAKVPSRMPLSSSAPSASRHRGVAITARSAWRKWVSREGAKRVCCLRESSRVKTAMAKDMPNTR